MISVISGLERHQAVEIEKYRSMRIFAKTVRSNGLQEVPCGLSELLIGVSTRARIAGYDRSPIT
jgi:hypothetical protein